MPSQIKVYASGKRSIRAVFHTKNSRVTRKTVHPSATEKTLFVAGFTSFRHKMWWFRCYL